VITLGARGCHFSSLAGSGHVPGERVTVVDTTGAGDAFTAGLLGVLAPALDGRGVAALGSDVIAQACREGNRLGSTVVTQMGATAGLPRRVFSAKPA